jgi:hypothetical protein
LSQTLSVDEDTGLPEFRHLGYGAWTGRRVIAGETLRSVYEPPKSKLEQIGVPQIVSTQETGNRHIVVSRLEFSLFMMPFVLETTVSLDSKGIADDFSARYRRLPFDPLSKAGTPELAQILQESSGFCAPSHRDFFEKCRIVENILNNRDNDLCMRRNENVAKAIQNSKSSGTAYEAGLDVILGIIKSKGFSTSNLQMRCNPIVEIRPMDCKNNSMCKEL